MAIVAMHAGIHRGQDDESRDGLLPGTQGHQGLTSVVVETILVAIVAAIVAALAVIIGGGGCFRLHGFKMLHIT